MKNEIEIKILADLKNVATVRVTISSFISDLQITIDDMLDIKTALSEAVTNAIEHGYIDKNIENFVNINCYIESNEEDKIIIEVIDSGIGIEDVTLAMTPEYTTKRDDEHAGMGFTIMESFMDEVIVDSKKDNGTKITLIKRIKSKKSL